MKVLITGANGVLGKNMTSYLLSKGIDNLYLLDIGNNNLEILSNTKFIKADICDNNLADALFHEVDIVIHCASASPSYSADKISSIVISGTKNIADSNSKCII